VVFYLTFIAIFALIALGFSLYPAVTEGKIRVISIEYDKKRNPILFWFFFVFDILLTIVFCYVLVASILI
jgi:hypothetical protein